MVTQRSDYDVMIMLLTGLPAKGLFGTLLKARDRKSVLCCCCQSRQMEKVMRILVELLCMISKVWNLAKDNQPQVIVQPLDMQALNRLKAISSH